MNGAELMQAAGGRRFLLCVLSNILATLLQAAGKLDGAGTAYAMIVIGTVGAYVAGNTTQKIKAPPQPDPMGTA